MSGRQPEASRIGAARLRAQTETLRSLLTVCGTGIIRAAVDGSIDS